VKSLKNFNHDNLIEVILLFTDNAGLCFGRASTRHQQGLHLVAPEIIREMYDQTLPLLKQHFQMIDKLTLININANEVPKIYLEFNKPDQHLTEAGPNPKWAVGLKEFLTSQLKPFLKKGLEQNKRNRPGRGPRL